MTDFEKLHDLGAHKIYEDTHITKLPVENILNKNFDAMSKVQFSGFVKILEREYKLDLEGLREEFGIVKEVKEEVKKEPFSVNVVENKNGSGLKLVGITVILLVVVGITYFSISSSDDEQKVQVVEKTVQVEEKNSSENKIIEDAKQNLNNLDKKEELAKQVEPKAQETVVEPIHPVSLIVKPVNNIWIGMVDLQTFKRSQKLGKSSFELDPEKDWLLVTGHSYLNFDVNGEEIKYSDKNKAWFSYEGGVLTKLTRTEFKEKNRGKAW